MRDELIEAVRCAVDAEYLEIGFQLKPAASRKVAEAALAVLEARGMLSQGWQDIASAPVGLPIDVWLAAEGAVPCRVDNAHQDETGRWYDGRGTRIWGRITHWMHLPAPPVAAAEGGE